MTTGPVGTGSALSRLLIKPSYASPSKRRYPKRRPPVRSMKRAGSTRVGY